MMATALRLDTRRDDDDTVVVTATGEIDLSNVEAFSAALVSAARENATPAAITVDLSAVKYLDSSAINVLFTHAEAVKRLRLIVHPFLVPVLKISGLSELAALETASGDGNNPHERG